MRFAFGLYALYTCFLAGFLLVYHTLDSFAVCCFLVLFGGWFSRVMWKLEQLNTKMLYREHMRTEWMAEQQRLEEERRMWEHSVPTAPRIVVPPRTTMTHRLTTAPLTQFRHEHQTSGPLHSAIPHEQTQNAVPQWMRH